MAAVAFGAAHAAELSIKDITQAENELGRTSGSNVRELGSLQNYCCGRWEKPLALDFPRAEESDPR